MYNIYNITFSEWTVISIPAHSLTEAQAEAEARYPGETFRVELDKPRKVIHVPYDGDELEALARVSRSRADPDWLP